MVNLSYDLYLILLDHNKVSYQEYASHVPQDERPKEYLTYALYLKNKGKALKRVQKQAEWDATAMMKNILR
ncbi:hypothetical protein QGM71_01280 [Virgibacillus sp. C22-A2]|uniref:Uncharacterized protein n=1 Tax=Virgibacillus tibetensis TaxID=3042313 RepID=A0ABU6KBD4_9BACI|nr:hypothetical protein [Virgibacillus sp. C22-A2]